MKKEVFLERLEALLQDIPEEEKRDAIDYYRDYLEAVGFCRRSPGHMFPGSHPSEAAATPDKAWTPIFRSPDGHPA